MNMRKRLKHAVLWGSAVAAFLLVGACKQEASKPPQEPRLVRAIVVTPNALSAANDTVGDIEPLSQVELSRILSAAGHVRLL